MAIVSVDDRGRIAIPRNIGVRRTRAILIPAGSFFVVIPLPPEPTKVASSWLSSKRSRGRLKEITESQARQDAVSRARRRKQL